MSRVFIPTLVSLALTVFLNALSMPLCAKVTETDNNPVAQETRTVVHLWTDNKVKPEGIVLAIHGLTMHGTMFDTMARHLVGQKFLVAAPDLRGYGKWRCDGSKSKVDYAESEADLQRIAETLRESYPGIPLFVAGESLGGTVALRMAAKHADLVDGLILSAPAVRHHHRLRMATVGQLAQVVVNPWKDINLAHYLEHDFSEDARITHEGLTDPLIRKELSLGELISSCRFMAQSAASIDDIPVDMPILIMQGKKDRMVKESSITLLERKLRSQKRTICWFPNRGHILLETKHVQAETLNTMTSWLRANCHMRRTNNVVTTVAIR